MTQKLQKAMFLLMERMKFVVEPAGAASLAYLISKNHCKEKRVAVLAGGNVDMYLLGQIVDKGLATMGRLLKNIQFYCLIDQVFQRNC